MGLPWKTDEDLNITSNEYTTKLSMNRCANRLLDNDKYLDGILDAGIDRATGLRFATREQVRTLDTVSGAISPSTMLALSATYNEAITGCATGKDKFITPSILNSVFTINTLLPKLNFIDVTYRGDMVSFKQVVDSAKAELDTFEPAHDTLFYVRCWYANVSDTLEASEDVVSIYAALANQVVTPAEEWSPTLYGFSERIMTFRVSAYGWQFVRERETYELMSAEQST